MKKEPTKTWDWNQVKQFGGVVIIIGFTAFIIAMLKNDLSLILGLMLIGGALYHIGGEQGRGGGAVAAG